MSIKVVEFTTADTNNYQQRKYDEFMEYYLHTNFRVDEILKIIGVSRTNSTAKYISKKLKQNGHNSIKRSWSIKKGEWRH